MHCALHAGRRKQTTRCIVIIVAVCNLIVRLMVVMAVIASMATRWLTPLPPTLIEAQGSTWPGLMYLCSSRVDGDFESCMVLRSRGCARVPTRTYARRAPARQPCCRRQSSIGKPPTTQCLLRLRVGRAGPKSQLVCRLVPPPYQAGGLATYLPGERHDHGYTRGIGGVWRVAYEHHCHFHRYRYGRRPQALGAAPSSLRSQVHCIIVS